MDPLDQLKKEKDWATKLRKAGSVKKYDVGMKLKNTLRQIEIKKTILSDLIEKKRKLEAEQAYQTLTELRAKLCLFQIEKTKQEFGTKHPKAVETETKKYIKKYLEEIENLSNAVEFLLNP